MSEVATSARTTQRLFGRRALLVMTEFSNPRFVGDLPMDDFNRQGLDLSNLHFRFETSQVDDQSPNACSIRVWNLAESTVKRMVDRFDGVVVQAGYNDGPFGTVFAGAVKQFRFGRDNNVDHYVDILASDGDVGYNFGVIASTLAAGTSTRDAINAAVKAMGLPPVRKAPVQFGAGQTYIRAKVAFGMGRNVLRDTARSLDASWSITNGEVQFTPLTGYQPGEAVVLNSKTGLIGIPELTNDGVRCRCLMNPKIRVGGLIKINNDEINRTIQQNPKDLRQFNSWSDINHLARVSADGTYQVFVAEHHGDTRGQEWYSELICLSVDLSSKTVKPYG
jgi:hypothetical protein